MMLFVFLALAAAASEVRLLEFSNLGYSGTYWHVAELNDIYSDACSCALATETTHFSGPNSPISEEVSVHFRGPLVLNKFAFYTAPDFTDGSDNGDWTRNAYYDASAQTAENVTFLTKAGRNSTCLGKALTYAGSDGISEAADATVLAEDTLINSEEEYAIFSNISCGSSGANGACGVYRDGIPAYHGYYGDIKMFLFEFKMPNETVVEKGSVYNWNMPAIWLLNAHIPRTAQYSTSSNCSCWRSGCGEFDIFEVKNNTGTQVSELYATLHDYQGTDDIESGIQVNGFIDRDYEGTMRGGVVFDGDGNASVFVSDSTDFNSTISYSDVSALISGIKQTAETQLSSVAPASSDDSSSSSRDSGASNSPGAVLFFSVLAWLFV